MQDTQPMPWFGARTVFFHTDLQTYEERVTIWRATNADDAQAQAEAEAEEYCGIVEDAQYLNLVQIYEMTMDQPESGSEVFSLMRDSDLTPVEYLNAYFDTGAERQSRSA